MKISEPFLLQTLSIAQSAKDHGNHPFGALLVHQDRVIATAENSVVSNCDVTAHAEMNLVRQAYGKFSQEVLQESVLYSSTEPCAMCCGAIYWAGVGSVVFGCSNKTLSEIAGRSLEIPCSEIFQRGSRSVLVLGPVLEERLKVIHVGFW
ncbi:MAG: nucleoside deaminase [Bdellovibrionia bacterium]